MITDKYFYSNRENLPLPIQRQLSEELFFFSFCIVFLEYALNLDYFETKIEPYSSYISEVIDSEMRAYLNP